MTKELKPVMTAGEVNTLIESAFPQLNESRNSYYAVDVFPGGCTVRLDATERHLRPGNTVSGPALFTLADIGGYYRDYVRLMAHIDRVQPGRVHRVIHEALLDDPETEVRALLAFLDQPFEEACLAFHSNARAVRTASSEQVRRPINRDGVDQWRPYDQWLGPLRQALGPVLGAYPAAPADFG